LIQTNGSLFRHVGYHLSETGDLREKFLPATLFRLIPFWRGYAHRVLQQIIIIQKPKRHEDVYTRDLIVALESFLMVLEIVERLCQSAASRTTWPQTLWFILSSHFARARGSVSSPVWNKDITTALDASRPPSHLRSLFSGVTNLVISLNDVELALYNYDIEVQPVVGMGILLHSIRYCRHTLAQWTVCQHMGHLDAQLLVDDHFLFPKLFLTSLPNEGREIQQYIFRSDPRPLSHPAATVFVFTVVVCYLLGYNDLRLLQLFLIAIHWVLYHPRQYSFHNSNWSSHGLRAFMCCLPLPLLAQIVPLSPTATPMMVILPPLIVIYGYCDAIHQNMLVNSHLFRQVQRWLSCNTDFVLLLYNSSAVFSLETQLNVFLLFLIVRDAIHFAIDPYSLSYVLGLYQKLDTGGDGSTAISVARTIR
jgi:hypothetical protein